MALSEMKELGSSGLNRQGGIVYEEYLRELQGPRWYSTVREMQDHPIVAAMLYLVEMQVRQVIWPVKPANETKQATKWADHVESCFGDMSFTWADTMSDVVTMFPYGHCLPADQTVLDENGRPRRIDEIRVGDFVLTKHGRSRKVNRVYQRRFDGDLIQIKVRGYPFPVLLTPEHRLPTTKEWKTAGELQVGDEVLRPKPQLHDGGDYESGFLVGVYLAEGSRRKDSENVLMLSIAKHETGELSKRINTWLERQPNEDVEVQGYHGKFPKAVANGTMLHKLTQEEVEVSVALAMEKVPAGRIATQFGVSAPAMRGLLNRRGISTNNIGQPIIPGARVYPHTADGGATISVADKRFADLINHWVGGNSSHEKHLLRLPTDRLFAKGVLDGWQWGDGWDSTTEKEGKIYRTAGWTTVSADLVQQVQILAGSLGLPAAMVFHDNKERGGIIRGRKFNSGNSYTLSASNSRDVIWKRTPEMEQEVVQLRANGMSMQAIATQVGLSYRTVWRWLHSDKPKGHGLQCNVYDEAVGHPITSIEHVHHTGMVYDLEVDEDHTFCAGPIIVSNCALELVYKIRGGQTGKAETDSRYDDGLIGWRQWANRPQDTISWQFDAHGGIQGIVQSDPYATPAVRDIAIPIDKLLLFRTTTGGKNNPEGRSVLRPAYSSWYMAQNLARIQAIFYERLNGVPWARVPSQVLSSTATVAQQNILTEMKKIVVNLRIDEQAGLVTPSDRDENGNLYYDLELLRADTSAGYDIEATIIRNEQRILMTMLAGAIMLGHDGVGSNALGATNMDMFWTGVDASVGSIAEVINRHAIPKLMRLNSVKPELWPTVVPGSVERVDLDKLGQYVVRLAGSGFDLTDPELQKYVLRQANMPVSNNLEKGIVVRPPVAGAAADAGGSAIAATKQRNTQGEGD